MKEEKGIHYLDACAEYSHFDPDKHEIKTEVKAITYHNLTVRKDADGGDVFIVDTTNSLCRINGKLGIGRSAANDALNILYSPVNDSGAYGINILYTP